MAEDESAVSLSERDMRAMAMELALQLPRNEKDAYRILDLMRVGYDFFLTEAVKPHEQKPRVVRGAFRR